MKVVLLTSPTYATQDAAPLMRFLHRFERKLPEYQQLPDPTQRKYIATHCFMKLGKESLSALRASTDSTNIDHRIQHIMKILFSDWVELFTQRENAYKKYRQLLQDATNFALVLEYVKANSFKMDWEQIQADMMAAHGSAQLEDDSASDDELGGLLGGLRM